VHADNALWAVDPVAALEDALEVSHRPWTGTRSSRRIMGRCQTDVACRVSVGDDTPDFRTVGDFREAHLARPEALFLAVLRLCAAAGLTRVGTVAPEGTKVQAVASRHKAMSDDRMKEEQRLKGEVAKMLAEAQSADAAEDAAHGPGRRGGRTA
jgi:hypothetical protein